MSMEALTLFFGGSHYVRYGCILTFVRSFVGLRVPTNMISPAFLSPLPLLL